MIRRLNEWEAGLKARHPYLYGLAELTALVLGVAALTGAVFCLAAFLHP